ncbi:MAG: Exodeoxyribonuclease VII large subunit (EC [uncultured Sulfurovum sp.]|uniref:Exodeoxyribonuclease 7 large subunit n=1 Tax=uncultured Sulfurovum sp. TaxID=269237 RepID=A0A6S6TJA9_9BACT|nr:MAG: Exodeoxyribonuclease VII large subunit (EC [uncultured Sulfurovum sp.]
MSQNMMSVSSLNTKIKSLLEATFMHTMVEGEVSSATYHTSGHLYFSIKDENSSIKCVMWRSSVAKMKFRIERGMHIVVEGSVSVYTPRGEYQFQTVKIEPYGQGALALAYEQLKQKLKAKGYFDIQRKKSIPQYIQRVALVTAKNSAALHDMLKIVEKRWPLLDITVVDTLVQGEQASIQIVKALQYADKLNVDVIVTGRGGGSTEDLWAFNEELVADAIYNLKTPVVSAVGHEVDTLISDYTADLRAPTPSAAMEMILPDIAEIRYLLDDFTIRFGHQFKHILQHKTATLTTLDETLRSVSPKEKLKILETLFRNQEEAFIRTMKFSMTNKKNKLPNLRDILIQQKRFIEQRKIDALEQIEKKFQMHNPKLQCHTGWAQVIVDGKKINLESLSLNQTFFLVDETRKIEAVCTDVKSFV